MLKKKEQATFLSLWNGKLFFKKKLYLQPQKCQGITQFLFTGIHKCIEPCPCIFANYKKWLFLIKITIKY